MEGFLLDAFSCTHCDSLTDERKCVISMDSNVIFGGDRNNFMQPDVLNIIVAILLKRGKLMLLQHHPGAG